MYIDEKERDQHMEATVAEFTLTKRAQLVAILVKREEQRDHMLSLQQQQLLRVQ